MDFFFSIIAIKGIVHFKIIFWYVLAYLKGIQDVGVTKRLRRSDPFIDTGKPTKVSSHKTQKPMARGAVNSNTAHRLAIQEHTSNRQRSGAGSKGSKTSSESKSKHQRNTRKRARDSL